MDKEPLEQILARTRLRSLPDSWKGQILQAASAASPSSEPGHSSPRHVSWREYWAALSSWFTWPSRVAWVGLAMVWVVTTVLHLTSPDVDPQAGMARNEREGLPRLVVSAQPDSWLELWREWRGNLHDSNPSNPDHAAPRSKGPARFLLT